MKIGNTRVAFTEALMELANENPKIILVCADSIKVIKADKFKEKYPERTYDLGIAEQNAVAFAAGIASCGFIPFVVTYAGFITMRACEQVRSYVSYPRLNVKFIGANGGIYGGEREGVSHQFFEDLGILRTIPGITIVVPADASQVKAATKAIAKCKGPAYLRIGSGRDPEVFEKEIEFQLGKARIIFNKGNDLAIFTLGGIAKRVLKASRILEEKGINVKVIEVHTLKPLDVKLITKVLQETGAAVTVEDHNIIGGLGSAIAEVSSENCPVFIKRIGLRDIFPESGDGNVLLDNYNMGIKDIVEASGNLVRKKIRSNI